MRNVSLLFDVVVETKKPLYLRTWKLVQVEHKHT